MLDEFFETVCQHRRLARPVFVINATLFVLLLLVFPFVEPGSSTYYVSLVSVGVIGVTLLAWGGLEYKCRQFEREKAGVFGDDE
jgi:asparagine N-glycosylation enzyme membrane subunit Stt3